MPKSLEEFIVEAALAGDAEWEAHERECHGSGHGPWYECNFTGPDICSAVVSNGKVETIYATPVALVALVEEWAHEQGYI